VRPFSTLLTFDEALKAVLIAAVPVAREEVVRIGEADGRVAAADVTSPIDVPPFDRSAMDGYAVIAEDTADARPDHPRSLECVDRLFTGEVSMAALRRGQCIEIATGAPMPDAATAVVMVEHTKRHGETVVVFAPVQPGQNIGRRGADIAKGARLAARGDLLTPSRVGALAGVGANTVRVYSRPSVAIFSTGNEVVQPGTPLGAGELYDINQFTLAAVVRRHGGTAVPLPVARDTLDDLAGALEHATKHDVAVFSGGSSVGDRDLLVDAIRAHGEVIFHGIAVKPGKPTLFGRVRSTLVFGMPGYPTSCLSNAYMLLLPLLRSMAHLPAWKADTRVLPLTRAISSTPDRHQFYTVRIVSGGAEPAFKASGDITSMADADGYIEIPVGTNSVPAGAIVKVTLF